MKRVASSVVTVVATLGFLVAACHEEPAPKKAPAVAASVGSPPPQRPADDSCRAASDCMKSTLTKTCCDGCAETAQSRTHFMVERDRCTSVPAGNCPKLDCPYDRKEVDCVKGQCVLRTPSTLQVAESSVRPLVPKTLPPSGPSAALEVPEASYKPFAPADGSPDAAGKAYFVAFQDDEARVEIFADNRVFKGKLAATQPVAGTKIYLLDDGFGGGRFLVLTQPDGTRRATFTVFGSGVPIISSERGPLVAGK
jgi:hypothetical protein